MYVISYIWGHFYQQPGEKLVLDIDEHFRFNTKGNEKIYSAYRLSKPQVAGDPPSTSHLHISYRLSLMSCDFDD